VDLSAAIHLLGEALGEVLRAQESAAFFETEEHIRALAKARRAGEMDAAVRLPLAVGALPLDAARTASAFAVCFDLISLAEIHRIQALRAPRARSQPGADRRSIGDAIAQLQARGVTPSGWPISCASCASSWC
jgi:phosphoenolpyruvate carboxylase